MRALKLFRRADDRPSLKDRAAALKARLVRIARRPDDADSSRRIMVAGSLAAAFPLPALAARAVPAGAHPDAELLELHAAFLRAVRAADAAEDAFRPARRAVDAALARCPTALKPLRWEYECVYPSFRQQPFGRERFRWVPPTDEGAACWHWDNQAWTGALLQAVIARAVPVLGKGGRTPHRIRRWQALLPLADAFDAEIDAVEAATGYVQADAARDAALAECERLRETIQSLVALTPEGMAALVRVIGEYAWKDTGGAWPNLLRSAAVVSGVPLADIEHERASRRGPARG